MLQDSRVERDYWFVVRSEKFFVWINEVVMVELIDFLRD